ncbi:uncharacterized protein PAC_09178 [Phialocephala subalpina]|uniref:Uncharacterized protein n=1 Tax=Phialocephala subalpina TaxID=576137 RepID=A0A1L7X2P0_9HELO|nr:uncharacterized protein PAC_09178 [Phialocephala subalpina]
MSFVKRNLEKQIIPSFPGKESTFEADVLSVIYETERAALEALVPPGLRLRGEPAVEVAMNVFHKTNFSVAYKESALAICVTDEKNRIDGKYIVAMTLDTDIGTFLRREANGFPKKIGDVNANYSGDRFTAYCARHGVCYASFSSDCSREPNDKRFADIAAQFTKTVSKESSVIAAFDYIWPMGLRKRVKPLLQPMWLHMQPTETKAGFGEVNLNWSKHDPWASLLVVKVLGSTITSGHITLTNADDKYYTEIDPETFLPYSFSSLGEPPEN